MGRRSALAIALLAAWGCQDGNKGGSGPAGSVSYANVKLTAPPSSGSASTAAAKPATVCRVISASGGLKRDVASGGTGGVVSGDVMGDSWVDLSVGAKLGLKNGTTTRELLFEGPGAVRACVNGEEEVWMPSGVFTSVIGAGETPGSEVWVVTPHAVVRYGSGAHITITTGVPRVDVNLASGTAWAYATDGGTWTEIPAGKPTSFVSKKSPSQILGDCEQASKAAHDLGSQIVSRDASLAEAAPQHVVARQKARAVCAIAELVAERSLDNVERQRLLPRARTANAKWREL